MARSKIIKGVLPYVTLGFCVVILGIIFYLFYETFSGANTKFPSEVNSVSISPQNILAAASDDKIFLWNGRNCIGQLSDNSGANISSVEFSHNGKLIVSCSFMNDTVSIWSLETRKRIGSVRAYKAMNVAFDNSDNYIICSSFAAPITVWDWKKRQIIKRLDYSWYKGMHAGFSISNNNILAYVDTNCILKIFNLNTFEEVTSFVNSCGVPKISSDGQLVAVKAKQDSIRVMNVEAKKEIAQISDKYDYYAFEPFALSTDGKLLANGIGANQVEIWDLKKNEVVKILGKATASGFGDILFHNRRSLVTAGRDRSVKIWDTETGVLKLDLGGDSRFNQRDKVIYIIFAAALFWGLCVLIYNPDNKYASVLIVSILTVWSLGIVLLLLLMRNVLNKYATLLAWTLTIFAALFVVSIYKTMIAIWILPLALFFGYLQVVSGQKKNSAIISILFDFITIVFFYYLKFSR